MTTVIKRIIEFEEQSDSEFRNYQISRLEYLQSLHTRSAEEQEQEKTRIFLKFRSLGIIDENGEFTTFYKSIEGNYE